MTRARRGTSTAIDPKLLECPCPNPKSMCTRSRVRSASCPSSATISNRFARSAPSRSRTTTVSPSVPWISMSPAGIRMLNSPVGPMRCSRVSGEVEVGMSALPSKGPDRGGGLVGADLVGGEALEDRLASLATRGFRGVSRCRLRLRLVPAIAGTEPERTDQRLDAGADRGVRDPELALHVAKVAARPEEALEERRLILPEAAEPPDAEVAFERRA